MVYFNASAENGTTDGSTPTDLVPGSTEFGSFLEMMSSIGGWVKSLVALLGLL